MRLLVALAMVSVAACGDPKMANYRDITIDPNDTRRSTYWCGFALHGNDWPP